MMDKSNIQKIALCKQLFILLCVVTIFLISYTLQENNTYIIPIVIRTIFEKSKTTSNSDHEYFFHPSCKCSRPGPHLDNLKVSKHWNKRVKISLKIPDSTFVGNSTCNDYASALGAGQKVISYSYYSPWKEGLKSYKRHDGPSDTKQRFLSLLEPLAQSSKTLYPGWRLRIYHNVTVEDSEAFSTLCDLYCQHDHVDLCDTRQLPGQGDLNSQFPVGRFWRFQVLGDPTVAMFGSRDTDSYLTEREAAAVQDWVESGEQWHVMRDGHRATMLAGLWGGHNYANMRLATKARRALLGDKVSPKLVKDYDQQILKKKVWPLIR